MTPAALPKPLRTQLDNTVKAARDIAEMAARAALQQLAVGEGNALNIAEMRRIYWVTSLTATAWDLFIVMLPVLGHRLGFSASVIGTVFSCFALGTFAARAVMPWLSGRCLR